MDLNVLFLTVLIGLCSAQSMVALLAPDIGANIAVVASVLGSDATATTYSLGCPSSVDARSCSVSTSYILTQGPATAHWSGSEPNSPPGATVNAACSLGGMTTFSCVIVTSPAPSSASGLATRTFTAQGTGVAVFYHAVTVTAGLVASTQATPTPGITGHASMTTLSGTQTRTTSGKTTTSPTNSGTSSATAARKTSSAGMPQITGNVVWAVGGMALAMAVVGL